MGEKVIQYFEKSAQDYLKNSQSFFWSFFRKRELQTIDFLLSPNSKMSLLDLGSGAGFYSIFFKNKYRINVLGVDSSPAMVEQLKLNGIEYVLDSIENFVSSEKFDLVLAAGVMEFVDNPEKVFRNILASIAPNGRLVILVPRSGIGGRMYKIHHKLKKCPVQIRSAETYKRIASHLGFNFSKIFYPTPISCAICFTISNLNEFKTIHGE